MCHADYTAAKQWPIFLLLHGNGIQGDDGLLPTRRFLADEIRARRDAFPVICVVPQAAKGEFSEQPSMQQLAIAELDQTVKEFRIDTSREYLIGYSMGAAGSYRIAYKWLERFAALATGAGTVQPIPASLGSDRATVDGCPNPFTVEPEPFSALARRALESRCHATREGSSTVSPPCSPQAHRLGSGMPLFRS